MEAQGLKEWQYKDPSGKMKLPVLKKMYAALRNAGSLREREAMLCAWDDVLGTAFSENDPALAAFYNWCTLRAVDEIRLYRGKTPRLWKFYSSGVIIKANGTVRAFDLNCGCERTETRSRLLLSAVSIRKLADVIDEYYVTHAHIDHIGVRLADELLKKGKTIITNPDTIRKWQLFPAQDAENRKASGYACFSSVQRIAGLPPLPNCAFVLKLADGCTILVKGDIYTGSDVAALCDWIDRKKVTVDYAIVSIFGLDEPKILPEVKRRFNSTVIPVHEWEFSHRPWDAGGRATQTFADVSRELRRQKCKGTPLFWGESVDLSPNRK